MVLHKVRHGYLHCCPNRTTVTPQHNPAPPEAHVVLPSYTNDRPAEYSLQVAAACWTAVLTSSMFTFGVLADINVDSLIPTNCAKLVLAPELHTCATTGCKITLNSSVALNAKVTLGAPCDLQVEGQRLTRER